MLGCTAFISNAIFIGYDSSFAHGVQRIAELVRANHDKTDKCVSSIKKIFVKCGRRKRLFTEMTKLPVPPEPVLTRWNFWLEAVIFIFEHHDNIKQFLATLYSEESIAVCTAKTMSEDGNLKKKLAFIAGSFRPICTAITTYRSEYRWSGLLTLWEVCDNVLSAYRRMKKNSTQLRQKILHSIQFSVMIIF